MSGHPARQLVLHNPGVKEATAKGVASYVSSRGISYHVTTEVHNTKETYKIIPFNQSAKSLLNGGIANGIGCNKAGTVRIQVCVINNRSPFKELKGKLPNDFLDLILDLCEKYKIPLKYVPHAIGRRVSEKNWVEQSGISAHRFAPQNDHTDLGLPKSFLRQLKTRAKARKTPVSPSKPTKPQPDTNTHTPAKKPLKTVVGTLQIGDTGKRVKKLQRALGGIKVDGVFGPQTKSKVKTFQRSKKILPDGVVGKITWKHLGYTMKTPSNRRGRIVKSPNTAWPTDKKLMAALQAVAKDLDQDLYIISGKRTYAEQKRLWDLYQAGKGNQAAYPNKNAPHIRGVAADTSVAGVNIGEYKNARKILDKHGLCLPVPGESWHIQGKWSLR